MSTCATKAAVAFLLLAAGGAEAAEFSMEVMPARVTHVDGDEEKFRAHHWVTDGFAGGLKDARFSHVFKNGASLRSQGHAIGGDQDFGGELSLEKEGDGFLRMDFSRFRKWFDGTGGTFYRNTGMQTVETDRDLALDIGRFVLEGGITPPPGYLQVGFEYEHATKDGAKSRLTWPSATVSGVAKKIGASWQEIDERVDAFTLKLGQEVAGFTLGAEQRWEFVRAEKRRFEPDVSTAATPSLKKIREQVQGPETDLMTTTLTADRSFLNERGFFSTGYHFTHLDNREIESIFETNAIGTVTNFSNPKQVRDARADNGYDAHTWVGSLVFKLFKTLTMTARLKAETARKESFSLYPADSAPASGGGTAPNGVIDSLVASDTEDRAERFGEALLLRFTGIPRTALYAEAEFEQGRSRLSEDRRDLLGPNPGETFNRYTIVDVDRGTFTLGGHASPCSFFNLTAHGRHRVYKNDYDDQRETDNSASSARSAFFDGQRIVTDEFAARAAFRPAAWVRPSVRYQLRDDNFSSRVEAEGSVETGVLSHIFSADVTFHPSEKLVTTFAYSRQLSEVRTPAQTAPIAGTYLPAFHTDVDSWLASADYSVCRNLALTGTLLYSRADNFDDFTAAGGLPLGTDDERVDVTAGLKWTPKEDVSVGLEYAYYHYASNPNAGPGDYDAHVVGVEGSKKF